MRSRMLGVGAVVAVVVSLALAGPVLAAPIIFFGEDTPTAGSVPPGGNAETARNSFLASLVGVGNEDFESFADGTLPPIGLSFPGSIGNLTATLSGVGAIQEGPSVGRFATSGVRYYEVSGEFVIEFESPVAAFGFYGTDIGDFLGNLVIELTDAAANVTQFIVPHTTSQGNFEQSLLFWGFIDPANTYTSVTFGNTAEGTDFFGFDDMVIGDLQQVRVPEPGTLLLLGVGLAGLAALRRRIARR